MFPFKFAALLLPLSFAAMAKATVMIPNELGAPLAGGLPRESSPAYDIVYGSVRVGQDIQRVIVTVPPGQGSKSALLFVGGLGCYSLDFSGTAPGIEFYHRVIDLAARSGFVTMRVEKSGMGDSKGIACQDQDFNRELDGYLAGLKALASYSFVQADQISIFGHSIGGVIAPYLAAQISVKSIAVSGTLAGNWYDYTLINTKRQMLLAGDTPEQVQQEMSKVKMAADELLIQKMSPAEITHQNPDLTNYVAEPVSYVYIQQLADLDVEAEWLKSNSKVLILSGGSDYIGSQYDELLQMTSKLNQTRSTAMQVLRVDQVDHFFLDAADEQESFNQKHADGSPLSLQPNIYRTLQTNFLSVP